ncbi:pyridoxamine 5'-phosphate oxidase family protein [Streptomyces sp. NPDC091649]|uniref:pyridoxamine 5'-phosphate oxidase family protein n=1 Tax=Streptomyces sp. NPDC091649 TaxID=3366004 RepID=UPI003824B8D9
MTTNLSHSRPQWHEGEEAVHRLLKVPYGFNLTAPGLPMEYVPWMTQSPLIALGAVDRNGRVWTTVLGGQPGTTLPLARGVLKVTSLAHVAHQPGGRSEGTLGYDPALEALFSDEDGHMHRASSEEQEKDEEGRDRDGILVRHEDGGRPAAGLVIDLETRTRVKIAGRVLGGAVLASPLEMNTVAGRAGGPAEVQVALAVDETLGNCPKYLNRKTVQPHEASPHLVGDRLPLPPEAVQLIAESDLFFISSRHGAESMDTNNRGGAPGFVRVHTNSDADGVVLVYPEYSGNRLFQTLGNIKSDPAVGITFPDFETGDVLYLTGRAEILAGADAASMIPHSKLAVRVRVEAARFVKDGLPFRGRLLDQSPYNPPVRRLAHEISGAESRSADSVDADGRPVGKATATLIHAHHLTPTISRYTFRLAPDLSTPRSSAEFQQLEPWRAGQHVTLDFSATLDRGWSHMRDHDPRSLNDDYIRAFTISSPTLPTPEERTAGTEHRGRLNGAEFEVTVRRNGPVTSLLAKWKPGAPLSATVLDFGGEEEVRYADVAKGSRTDDDIIVVAAGVGITPLMAQAQPVLESGRRMRILWSLKTDDLPLAVDVLEKVDGLGAVTELFVTRSVDGKQNAEIDRIRRLGTVVRTRRIQKNDVLTKGTAARRRFYVCTGPGLRASVLQWAAGEYVQFEKFDY